MEPYQKRIVNKKIKVLEHSEKTGNVSLTCRYFEISRQTFYEWEMFYNLHRPHYSLSGKTPFEVLMKKLKSEKNCHPWS